LLWDNVKALIQIAEVVSCIYVNTETGQFWVIDYRIYNPDGDGKSKLDHVAEMLQSLIYHKSLPFRTVLMDSWYATKDLMQYIDSLGKYYYYPRYVNQAGFFWTLFESVSTVEDSQSKHLHYAVEAFLTDY